jgi:hypothetical protein
MDAFLGDARDEVEDEPAGRFGASSSAGPVGLSRGR